MARLRVCIPAKLSRKWHAMIDEEFLGELLVSYQAETWQSN